jgi:hypothetical protein
MSPIRNTLAALLLIATAAAVSAGPELKIDNPVYSGGKAAEGSILKAQFKLTNTGDEPLKLESVRPGCGCTVVSYDTVIAPGKSGFIRPEVNLKNFRPGLMSRSVTVKSNASATPLILTIEAMVVAPIEVSENYLDFENTAKLTLLLSSAKADLKVSGVVFKPQQGGQNIPAWAANTPVKVKFALAPAESSGDDGMKTYKLDINAPASGGKETVVGTFEITTNHPEKKDIAISGRVR